MSLAHYLSAFSHLNKAPRLDSPLTMKKQPHKPLLLLAVLDLIGAGYFPDNRFYLSPELNDLFDRYWSIGVPGADVGDITMPFTHLPSDGFWQLTEDRHPFTRSRIAKFDDELFALAADRNLGGHLITTANRPIILPAVNELYPAKPKLAWHREKVFVA